MKYLWALIAVWVLLSQERQYAYGAGVSLELDVGETKSHTLAELAKAVSIDQAGIIKIEKGISKKILLITGVSYGEATVEVTMISGNVRSFSVQVAKPGSRQRLANAKQSLSSIPGLSIHEAKNKLVVSGVIAKRAHLKAFVDVKSQYPQLVVDKTQKKIRMGTGVVAAINHKLSRNGITSLKARSYGSLVVLEGMPLNAQQKSLAMRLAQSIYPNIGDYVHAKGKGGASVSVEVVFIELQKQNDYEVGFPAGAYALSGEAVAGATPLQASVSSLTQKDGKMTYMVGPFSTFLRMIQQTGAARVLANPKLRASSGTAAKFHAGQTTFLVSKTVSGDADVLQESVQDLQLGISLEVEPLVDGLGQIDARIKTNVSDVGAELFDGKPTINTTTLETQVMLNDGESLLLSGLHKRREAKRVDRIPFLADIPIIGELFKSRSGGNEQTELHILVTMSLVNEHDQSPEPLSLWQAADDDINVSFFD